MHGILIVSTTPLVHVQVCYAMPCFDTTKLVIFGIIQTWEGALKTNIDISIVISHIIGSQHLKLELSMFTSKLQTFIQLDLS